MIEFRDILMCVGEEHYPTPQDFINEVLWQGLSKRLPLQSPPQGMVKGVSRIFLRHPKSIAAFALPFLPAVMEPIPLRGVRVWEEGSNGQPALVAGKLLGSEDTWPYFEPLSTDSASTKGHRLSPEPTPSLLDQLQGLENEVVNRVIAKWQRDCLPNYRHFPSLLARLKALRLACVDELFERWRVRLLPGIFGYTFFSGFSYIVENKAGEEVEVPAVLARLEGLRVLHVIREGNDEEEG